jgi:hypothetical protein
VLRIGLAIASLIVLALWVAGSGWLGAPLRAGDPVATPRPAGELARRMAAEVAAAAGLGTSHSKQILFGDFHVHTGFSEDAFTMSMPLTGGSGTHTVADACDFARFCSDLDFWSINDHAESSTPRRWRETIESVRQCNAVSGPDGDADLVSFLGWEWSHMGTTAENHYGHRNVVLRDLDDARIPARPIASDSPADYFQAPSPLTLGLLPVIAGDAGYLRYATYSRETGSVPRCADGVPVRELPPDCREYAATPGALLDKLDEWGHASLVIPHGTTWGMYTPQGSAWPKQLNEQDHDPVRQRLVEVYSGHGNSEEYRAWRAVDIGADGVRSCPPPRADYLPSCWRAGEIIRERCSEAGETAEECDARAGRARQHFAEAPGGMGHLSVPFYDPEEWRDAGQCRDCFLPSLNYRPASSVQSMLALSKQGPDGLPLRFRFGFLASSDIHTARPGSGYKELLRTKMSDTRMSRVDLPGPSSLEEPLAESRAADPSGRPPNEWIERGRAGSFYFTGGLVAVHAERRDRNSIWQALDTRETYGTSGPRILLWFDLLNPPGADTSPLPMGSIVAMEEGPVFEVRAAGSLEQLPGCGDAAQSALSEARLERLCGGECYRPSDTRRPISRIEVVRIRPQRSAAEPLEPLIEDPWRTFECAPDPAGCTARFSDPDFATGQRDSVYYVRAIEAQSEAVNGQMLRCEGDSCERMRPCDPWAPESDDCLGVVEERAWSSPLFVDWQS